MSETDIRNTFNNDIGNSQAKIVLLWLSYCCQTSFSEISIQCEIDLKAVDESLCYLTENGFIRKRNGCIPAEDYFDIVFQWELLVSQVIWRRT